MSSVLFFLAAIGVISGAVGVVMLRKRFLIEMVWSQMTNSA